jgi:hypothetical protein
MYLFTPFKTSWPATTGPPAHLTDQRVESLPSQIPKKNYVFAAFGNEAEDAAF